jgi:carbon monoxide dehydrogenase subunit G
MEITGSKKIKAGQQQVFQALLDPAVLKACVPGCSEAEYVDVNWESGRHIKLGISLSIPGLSGSYNVFIRIEDVVEPSHLVLVSSPSSAIGSINARCVVDLASEGDQTTVNYVTEATLDGKLSATPEFVIKTAVKSALDHFFKNLEKHIG